MIRNSLLLGVFRQLLIDRVCQTDHKTECVRGDFRSALFRKELVKLRSYGVIAQVGIKLHAGAAGIDVVHSRQDGIQVVSTEVNEVVHHQLDGRAVSLEDGGDVAGIFREVTCITDTNDIIFPVGGGDGVLNGDGYSVCLRNKINKLLRDLIWRLCGEYASAKAEQQRDDKDGAECMIECFHRFPLSVDKNDSSVFRTIVRRSVLLFGLPEERFS